MLRVLDAKAPVSFSILAGYLLKDRQNQVVCPVANGVNHDLQARRDRLHALVSIAPSETSHRRQGHSYSAHLCMAHKKNAVVDQAAVKTPSAPNSQHVIAEVCAYTVRARRSQAGKGETA